jgi:hypothetical protein
MCKLQLAISGTENGVLAGEKKMMKLFSSSDTGFVISVIKLVSHIIPEGFY